jgi:RNA polymerase-binding transcription factor DksA
MPNINEKVLNELRDKLLIYRKQLQQEIHDELVKEGSSSSISLAGKVHDKQEESLSEMLTQINLAMLSQHLRMEDGEYGTCIDCDAAIAIARLQAYPTAVRCISCQAIHEKE